MRFEDDLRQAWQDPQVWPMLCQLLEHGMFKNAPALALQFLGAVDAGCSSDRSCEQVYDDLYAFLQDAERRGHFSRHFAADEAARIRRRVEQFTALVPAGEAPHSFADVGCGTGLVTAGLAQAWKLPRDRAFGVEVFERSQAPDVFTPLPFEKRRIPLPDGSIDLATVIMVLHHETDPQGLLREVFRILKSRGLLLLRETDADTPALLLFNHVMEHFYFRVFNRLPGVPNPFTHRSASEWADMVRSAGFSIEKTLRPEPGNPFTPVHFVLRKPAEQLSGGQGVRKSVN
jgi:ubiquinone/menaquinone biosynthesis C-methylase UbiE